MARRTRQLAGRDRDGRAFVPDADSATIACAAEARPLAPRPNARPTARPTAREET